MKNILAVCTTVLLAAGLALSGTVAANAAEGGYAPCVPSEAYTEVITPEVPAVEGTPAVDAVYETVRTGWQRYSWTGGPWTSETPPAFPSDNWQANVEGDPHDIGVPGAYFVSHGNSGNGDWFYLEGVYDTHKVSDAVPAVPGTPYIPAVTKYHPAVVCEEEPEEPTTVTPLPPTFADFCGVENDAVNIPDDTEGIKYEGTLTEDGFATVTATAKEDYTFGSGNTLTWNFQFTNEECPVEEPPVVYPPTEQPPVAVPPVVLPDCDDITYDEAQTLLASDSVKYGYLDNNKDGIACEALAAAPVAETLPETGQNTTGTLGMGAAAFLLLMAGAAAILFNRRKTVTE